MNLEGESVSIAMHGYEFLLLTIFSIFSSPFQARHIRFKKVLCMSDRLCLRSKSAAE